MEEGKDRNRTGKTGKGIVVIAGIIIAVLLIAVVAMAFAMTRTKPQETAEEPEKKDVITEENAEEIAEELLTVTPTNIPQSYTVTQNSEWHFPDGNTESTDAYVENDRENETPVYFDVIIDETGETVYSSPILSLGAKIENFKLDTPLGAGTYQCTVIYHLVDEDQNELTTVEVGHVIIVEN